MSNLDNGVENGWGDVEAENADGWARHPSGWAEQPADDAEDAAGRGELPPADRGAMPESTPQQGRWAEQGGQHPDVYSEQRQGQGMTPQRYGRPREYGPEGEYDAQGEEPYGRRGVPPGHEPAGDVSDERAADLGQQGRYGEEQHHYG